MQYLAIFLLVGLGLASAYKNDFDDGFSIDKFENVDKIRLEAGGWIADQMKQAFEKMMEGFEKAMEQGQDISERAFRKAEEMYHKLMDWGIEMGEKVKEIFERVSKNFDNNAPRHYEPEQAGGWIAEQMRMAFEKMMEGFEKAMEEGKTVGEKAFRKAEEMYHKLMDWGVEMGEKAKEIFERISQNFNNGPRRYLPNQAVQKGPMIEKLKEAFENIVNRIKERFESGDGVGGPLMKKAQDIFQKLKDMRVGGSWFEKMKQIFEDLKSKITGQSVQKGPMIDKLKEAFENIVNRIKERFESGEGVGGPLMKKAQDIFQKLKDMNIGGSWFEKMKQIFEDLKSKITGQSVQRGPMLDKMKEAFENVVNKIKEAFESGKGVRGDLMKKAEDIFQKLKDMRAGGSWFEKIKQVFEDLRSKLGKNSVPRSPVADRMKEAFENIVNRIKEAFENGKGVRGDLMKKAEDIYEKLKNLKVEISEKIKSIFEDLRSKMERTGNVSQDADISNVLDIFRKLKKLIKEKFDAEKIKAKVEELFGKGSEISEQIIEMLKTKGEKAKQKILDWLDRIVPDKEERSASEFFEKLREYFKDLHLELKEKFSKFGEWVKEQYEKGLEKGKDRAENIKKIAKEFIDDTKVIGKEMAKEALGFFQEYKNDLGNLYDNVVDKVSKILKS